MKNENRNARMALTRAESGAIALEATISMTVFVFVVLALYSIVTLFMAQSMIGHALIQSCESLALETYSTEKLHTDWSTGRLFAEAFCLLQGEQGKTEYTTDDLWYKESYGNPQQVVDKCEERFYAYFAGGKEKADGILKVLRVNELDFGESKLSDKDLTIDVSYKIKLLFGIDRAFGSITLNEFETRQSACARLWADPEL